MFTGAVHFVPGQALRTFTVYRDGEHKTASGRVISNGAEPIGEIRAVLSR